LDFSSVSLEGKKIFVVLHVCHVARDVDGSVSVAGQVFFRLLAAWLLVLDLMKMRLVESRICDAETTFREILCLMI
jgi:hypothetical protein